MRKKEFPLPCSLLCLLPSSKIRYSNLGICSFSILASKLWKDLTFICCTSLLILGSFLLSQHHGATGVRMLYTFSYIHTHIHVQSNLHFDSIYASEVYFLNRLWTLRDYQDRLMNRHLHKLCKGMSYVIPQCRVERIP